MGAWIEIEEGFGNVANKEVAPYMGAWIEIQKSQTVNLGRDCGSHPTWVRGLK